MHHLRATAAAAALLGALTLTSPAVDAAPKGGGGKTPTMQGEVLGSSPNDVALSGTCSTTEPSVISFSTSGPAQGPYPGTYTETGQYTIEYHSSSNYTVTAFSASFTITSGDVTITGTKELTGAAPFPDNIASCTELDGGSPNAIYLRDGVTFSATITNGRKTTQNIGIARTFATVPPPGSESSFNETFDCVTAKRRSPC